VVGERSNGEEASLRRTCGAIRSENAGVSNEKRGENPLRRKPKDSRGRLVRPG
jgi:hypothetical protein